MKARVTVRACLLSILLLAGCATTTPAPRIDGSSAVAFNRSMARLQVPLNDSQRRALSLAMIRIHFMDVHSAFELIERPELGRMRWSDLRDEIDGMAFQDILDYADRSAVTISTESP